MTGLDLTEEYIDIAKQLTEMVGLSDTVRFIQGSALELPFENALFDVVWTEHAQMNIENKELFYAEISRVLRPSGRLLFHDIFRGEGEAPSYPVPWAENESISFLATEASARAFMEQAGLSIVHWEDKATESLKFFQETFRRISQTGPPPLGIHQLMGDNAVVKIQNYVRNLTENRVSVALGRVDKP